MNTTPIVNLQGTILNPKPTMSDSTLVAQAELFSAWVHDGQVRKYNGNAYSTHPRRCAQRAFDIFNGFILRDDVTIAMFLHDGPEDQEARCPISLIWSLYGLGVSSIVKDLTNPSKGFPLLNRAARKAMDRKHYEDASVIVKCCKAIDRIDNLGEMDIYQDPGFAKLYCEESLLLLEALRKHAPFPASKPIDVIANNLFAELNAVIIGLKAKMKETL